MEKKVLTLIVPAYNEEAALEAFYKETSRVEREMAELCEFEYLFIDDGSKDGTLAIIKKLHAYNRRVHYISFSRNFGKEAAIYAGLENASGDYVAILDADLQDPPALLPEMWRAVTEEGYDCVGSRRVTRAGEPPIRSFFARAFYKLINRISKAEIVDGARDFQLMSRKVVDAILSMGEYNRFSKGIFGWVGFKKKWLEYENIERVAGETKWSFWSLFKYAVEGIIAFSTAPLMISILLGIALCAAGFVMAVVLLVKLIAGAPVTAAGGLTLLILLVGGLVMVCIGISGQYLARTYLEVKKRPIYIIGEAELENSYK